MAQATDGMILGAPPFACAFGWWAVGRWMFSFSARRAARHLLHCAPFPNFPNPSMSTKKPLNIGIVGYGFMGRTHANAYKRVNDFFDLEYRPVLKAVCGRSAEGARAF